MYRKRTSGSIKFNERMARARAAKERLRLERAAPEYPPELPLVRRRVVVEDYDCGEMVRHEFMLHKSNRSDCYYVEVDGKMLIGRHGWAKILQMIRKALPRVGRFL